jgi:hypothetical protein
MNRHHAVAPRSATIDRPRDRREGRVLHHASRIATAFAGLALAGALAACTPGASVPVPSITLPSGLPSVDASAVASAASGAALTALDQVDAAITANTNATGLTADDASSLTQLTGALRTAVQSGDASGIKTALTDLSTKVDSFATKLSTTDSGKQLIAAFAALKAALPAG